MFSESPCGLADSEIRIPHCAGLQIRRSVSRHTKKIRHATLKLHAGPFYLKQF